MAHYVAGILLLIGLFIWCIQQLLSIFFRSFVTLYGSDEDRRHIAETRSTIEAMGLAVRIMRTPPAPIGEVKDPALVAVEKELALTLAQANLAQARRGLDGAPAAITPALPVQHHEPVNEPTLPALPAAGKAAVLSVETAGDAPTEPEPDLGTEGLSPPPVDASGR